MLRLPEYDDNRKDQSIGKCLIFGEAVQNSKVDYGETPLHGAVGFGCLKVVEYLVEHGAIVDSKGVYEETPMSAAARDGYLNVVKYLLNCGAKIETRDFKGSTPLQYAVGGKNIDIINYLTQMGANINSRNNDGITVLHIAASNGHLEGVIFLLDHSADINSSNSKGLTPLHCAVEKCHFDVMKYLIDQGIQIDVKDNKGLTPLHYAVKKCDIDIVEYLIKNGADVNIKDDMSETPLDHAYSLGDSVIILFLEKNGALLNRKTKECNYVAQDFFPLNVGNEWTMTVPANDRKTITKVIEKKGDTYILSNDTYIGITKVDTTNQIIISNEKGICCLKEGYHFYYIKNPIRLGITYINESYPSPDGSSISAVVTDLNKTVTVPAGTFHDCLEITWYSGEDRDFFLSFIFALNVGLIKVKASHFLGYHLSFYKINVNK